MSNDDGLRKKFRDQAKLPAPGVARAVRVEGGVVLHPDDRDAQMTRIAERRVRRCR